MASAASASASADPALSFLGYIKRDMRAIESFRNDDDYPMVLFPSSERNDILYLLMIASPDSRYAYTPFFFKIVIPKNYPDVPPAVTFLSTTGHRIHPNLYPSGKVCLSILGTWSGPGWNASMGLNTVALSIYSLLNVTNPLSCEPSFEEEETKPGPQTKTYNTYIQLISYKHLLKLYNGSDVVVKEPDVSEKLDIYLKYYLKRHLDDIDYLGQKLLDNYQDRKIRADFYGSETVVFKREDKDKIMEELYSAISKELRDESATLQKHFPQMLETREVVDKKQDPDSESEYHYSSDGEGFDTVDDDDDDASVSE